jgi:FkbM family methyltransferase
MTNQENAVPISQRVASFVPVRLVQHVVKIAVSHPMSRKMLNTAYCALSWRWRARFHRYFARIFQNKNSKDVKPGVWKVKFANAEIKMPLTPDRLWLDWNSALSIVGHDVEIKETYEAILLSNDRPDIFIDAGANYGTHSLLFLAEGVDVYTFEPNPNCYGVFFECCALNQLNPKWNSVALGDTNAQLVLSFPESETWLGTVKPVTAGMLRDKHDDLISNTVDQKLLDEFLPQLEKKKVLIKIDTEGFEAFVIRGAKNILSQISPKIIFESDTAGGRKELFDLFSSLNYGIDRLPWDARRPLQPLNAADFLDNRTGNFIAFPNKMMA